MIWYCLTALIFIAYLEITGQYILYKINKQGYFKAAFGFGFMALLAYGYLTTGILTFFDCSFYLILSIFALYFILSFIFVIRDFKKIKWHFHWQFWFLSIFFVGILLYYSYNTTLGHTSGFDSTFYLNMVSTNIGTTSLNTKSVYFGTYLKDISGQYTFQSYYYFLSCFIFIIRKALSLVMDTNNFVIMIWVFQILYDYFLFSLIYNILSKIAQKKYFLWVLIIFIYLFFYGKIYFNNVFGFYGNTYRTVAITYAIMALYDIFKKYDKNNWIIFGICIYAACAFSSSGVFTSVFLLFGMYFVLVEKMDNLFKYYSLILFMPLIDLLCVLKPDKAYIMIGGSLLLCLFIWVFNDRLIKLSRMKYTRIILVILSFLTMFILSYRVTHNLFDFSAFSSGSEIYDMTISFFKDYLMFGYNEKIYRYLFWFIFAFAIIFENKNKLVQIYLLLFLVIFNPFCCSFLNSINVVYYRSHELLFNPFSFILFINLFFEKVNNKYVYYGCAVILLCIFIKNTDFKTPMYYHESFVPSDNYNNLMKMTNDEYDIVEKIQEEASYRGISSPYIISNNLFTQAIIPSGRYIYGRVLNVNKNWSTAEKQLYAIFYPGTYDNNVGVKPDYDNMAKYIKEAGIDYIVVDKSQEIYDEDSDSYGYFIYKVAECGIGYSIYSNDSYELFYYGD